jgi:hypothetical protein
MKARSNNSRFIETLEARSLMSAVAEADFNNDGRMDKAEVTSSTTITVSLKNLDGSYTVSAKLTAPKSQPVNGVNVSDVNGDGKLDIQTGGANGRFYSHQWLGNDDGTFGARYTWLGKFPKGFF